MNANELMIGDWVYAKVQVDDTGTEPVYETIPKRVSELSRGINGIYTEDTSTFAGAEILPIPLTPEILENNGFTPNIYQVNDVYGTRFNLDEYYSLTFFNSKNGASLTKYYTNKSCFYITTINYVHELQHALRLAGIKKEIVL